MQCEIPPLSAVKIVVSDTLPKERVQVRFPRSKKQRIRRKWAKQSRNFRQVDQAFRMGDTLYVPRSYMEELRKRVEGKTMEWVNRELLVNGA